MKDRLAGPNLKQPSAKASAFAEWVYQCTAPQKERVTVNKSFQKHRMELGEVTHDAIERFMQLSWTKRKLDDQTLNDWYCYFADRSDAPRKIFTSSRLQLNGSPMRCIPDLVLRNDTTNRIIIIERKTTFVPEPNAPREGWPNVQAQLWCYSWIDEFADAEDVLLIGQLWHRRSGGLALYHEHPSWRKSNDSHHQTCSNWFQQYGGIIYG